MRLRFITLFFPNYRPSKPSCSSFNELFICFLVYLDKVSYDWPGTNQNPSRPLMLMMRGSRSAYTNHQIVQTPQVSLCKSSAIPITTGQPIQIISYSNHHRSAYTNHQLVKTPQVSLYKSSASPDTTGQPIQIIS